MLAGPQEAGQQQVAEPRVAERAAEDAATRQDNRAAERLDAPGLRTSPNSLEKAERFAAPSPQAGCEPLGGLDPVRPQLQLIEIYRLVMNVDVCVVDERVDTAKMLFQRGQGAVTRGASIQLVLDPLRLCLMSVAVSTITWNALWRGVVARIVPNTW
ncbi:hypothetical protein PI124_g15974 [Phytophthora idaei]|nr:hypothetical protein PI124_g15974 [Phytophthora idaei]